MKFSWREYYNRSVRSGCKAEDFTPEVCFNAGVLIDRLNMLGYGPAKVFSSCLRSLAKQKEVYRAKGITDESKMPLKSCHLTGEAVDIADDGALQRWLKQNVKKLEELDLYVEDFDSTPTWVHIQTRPTKNRFFKP